MARLFRNIKEIQLIGRNIKLIPFDGLSSRCGDDGVWAESKNEIRADSTLCDESYDITVLHELQHAIFDVLGEGELSCNEGLVQKLAEVNYQLIKQIVEHQCSKRRKNERNI